MKKDDNDSNTGIWLMLYSIGNNLDGNVRKRKVTLEDRIDMLDADIEENSAIVAGEIAEIEDREYDLECILDDLEDYLEDREYGLNRSLYTRDERKEIEQMSDAEILEEMEKINEELLRCREEKDMILNGGGILEKLPLIQYMSLSILSLIKSFISLIVLIIGLIILFKFFVSLF